MVLLKNNFKRLFYANLIRSLKKTSSADLAMESQKKALLSFEYARDHFPAYRKYLEYQKLEHLKVADVKSFKERVPLLNKNIVYENESFALKNLTIDTSMDILLSSGSSGKFSFGLHSQSQSSRNAEFLNVLLDHYFNILGRKTLIINCLTQAVRLQGLDATLIESGPRIDALLYLLKVISPQFEQTVLIGDNFFIKNALEEATIFGINFAQLNVHLVLGGVFLPESLRNHLNSILNATRSYPALIFSSMGVSEFGLNLFFESPELIRLRRLTEKNGRLRQKLLGSDVLDFTPMYFNYFPQSFYLEEISNELVITSLNLETPLLLVRYNTQDRVKIIRYEELEEILKTESEAKDLLPVFKSPLVLIYGKGDYVEFKGKKIYPQQVQEGLYRNFEVAAQTTGYFRMRNSNDELVVDIQLKKGIEESENLTSRFRQAISSGIKIDVPVIPYPYQEFPYGMELDYERKFRYI